MKFFNIHSVINTCFVVIVICFLAVIVISQSPKEFPQKQFSFNVAKGESVSSIADDLYVKKMISSPLLFKITAIVLSKNKGVKAGDYRFNGKESAFKIANRFIAGDQKQPKAHITIFEGTNVQDMALIYLKNLPNFNAAKFVSLAKDSEGYLYPDTYDFLENVKSEEIIRVMKKNFDDKLQTISKEISASRRSLKDIVTMASIVEKEANIDEDRRIVAGILWKRLDEGMLLQVDPPFYYITGKSTGVTFADLKIDSPYNTYKYKGLPKGPIDNPSIDAIEATINPTTSKSYFYLTGHDGKMYYATTYDGHLKNKSLYLK